MQNGKPADGWAALSNISSFMSFVEKRKKLKLIGQLDAQLDYCQYLIRTEIHNTDEVKFKNKQRKKQLGDDRVRALKALAIDQLICHYNVLVQQIGNLSNGIYSPPPLQQSSFLIIQAFAKSYNLKIWKKKKLRFDRQNHIIYAEKDKKIKIYDLANYIIRKSTTTDYICMVLEAINEIPVEKSKTVHFGFQYKNTFNLWLQSIRVSIVYKQWERVANSLHIKEQIQKYRQKEEMESHIELNRVASEDVNLKLRKASSNSQHTQMAQSMITGRQSGDHPQELQKIPEKQQKGSRVVKKQSGMTSIYSQNKGVGQSVYSDFPVSPKNKASEDIDALQIIKNCYARKFLKDQVELSILQMQFQLQNETEQIKNIKKKANIHQILLQNKNLSKVTSLDNFSPIQLFFDVKSSFLGRVFIYSHNTQRNHFKFCYLSPFGCVERGFSKQTLLKRLLDPESIPLLNNSLKSATIQSVMASQNCTINLQEHHPHNKLFRPRQFLFLRHLIKNNMDEHFIIDRSFEQASMTKKQHFVRGRLFNVTRVSQSHHEIMLFIDINMSNMGDLNADQEVALSKNYMNRLALGLSEYFSKPKEDNIRLLLYDYDRSLKDQDPTYVLPVERTLIETSFSESLDVEVPNQSKISQNSIRRIPGGDFLRQKSNRYNQSMFVGKQDEDIMASLEGIVRRTYEPPRRPNKNYLHKKLNFLNTNEKEEHFDWKFEIVPEWTVEWVSTDDQGQGSFVYKHSQIKHRDALKQILEYTCKTNLKENKGYRLSFPVAILAPQTKLQRVVKALSYASSLFENTMGLSTMQLFRKTIIFGLLTTLLSLKVTKEFDSIIGETYQSQLSSSCKGYAEQITNDHIAFFMKDTLFEISGVIEPKLKFLMNSATGEHQGTYRVKLNNKTQICFTTPPGELTGLVYGTPTFKLLGKSYFWLEKQCLYLQLDFEPNHAFSTSPNIKADYFQGTIYQMSPQWPSLFAKDKQMHKDRHIVRKIEKVSGRWSSFVDFDSQKVQLKKIPLFEMTNQNNSLPSDSSFREDINYLKLGRIESAQAKKDEIQDQDLYDARLRMKKNCL